MNELFNKFLVKEVVTIAKSNLTSKVLTGALVSTGALALAGVAHADTQVTVQAGDTVSQLALANNSTVDAISQKNQLADPNFIVVGQQLDIPNDDNDQSQSSNQQANAAAINNTAATTNATADQIGNAVNNADSNNTIALQNATVTLPNQFSANTTVATTNNNPASNNTSAVNPQATAYSATASAGAGASTNTPVNASHSPQQAVAIAQQQVGTPYVWGGNQPGGFDCSGLVQYAYGLDAAHRTTYTQQTMGAHRYDVENAQPGDIYFWGSDSAPYHEALATGNGNYIQAPRPGQNVQNGNINYYRPNYFVSMQ